MVAGAAAVSGAMISSAKETASNMDVIDKASIRMGISAESYQELAHAAGLCGVEMTTMEKAAKKLEGTDLNLDDALDQLMAIEDGTDRTNAAISLFGEDVAYKMTPLLQSGADGLAAMKQEANDLGLVMSQDVVTQGAEMNDQFSRISEGVDALKKRIGAAFMPVLISFISIILGAMPKVQGLIDRLAPIAEQFLSGVLQSIIPLAEELLPPLFDLVEQLLPFLQSATTALLPIITKLLSTLMPPLIQMVEMLLPVLIDLITPLLPILEPLLDLLKPFVDILVMMLQPIIQLIDVIVPKIVDWVVPKISAVVRTFTDFFSALSGEAQKFTDFFSGVFDTVGGVIDKVGGFFDGVGAKISGFFGGSHASGLEYVPYDGYTAVLHRGEKVLTADQAQRGTGENTGELAKAIQQLSERISSMQITLDGDKVVGGIAGRMNSALGTAYSAAKRGVLA